MIQTDPVGYENGQNGPNKDAENLNHKDQEKLITKIAHREKRNSDISMEKVSENDYNSDDENNMNTEKNHSVDQPCEQEEIKSPNKNLFPPDQLSMQSFQSAIAQFTATAVANNMDNDTVVKNLAVLQSALFTLQQQQFLQFQLIQHLQSELIKKQSDKSDTNKIESDGEGETLESRASEMHFDGKKRSQDMRNRTLSETSDRALPKSRDPEKEPLQLTPMKKLTNQEDLLTYQNSFPSAVSHIITEHDDLSMTGESNSLAMLEKKAEEVLSSASQGILSNNLMDELAFANDNANSLARNDPALFKHRCRYCGKIFGSDSSLQIHVRSHTGERPYKCNICGSRFTTRGNLKVHFQRHSDKYPHIPMNPNPVPEHLDKYFPPLMPHEAIKEGPSSPEHMPLHMQTPFPGMEPRQLTQREMIPEFFLPRPPIDYMNTVKDLLPVDPVDLSRIPQKIPEKLVSTPPLSPKVIANENSEIKLEPMEEVVETDEEDEPKSPLSLEPQTILTEEHEEYDEEEREHPQDSRKITRASNCEKTKVASVSPASNSSSNSGSLYQDTVLDPTYFPSHHMPRPDSTDSSWENFIEITSDASKLQDLVDSSDNKNIEPNQCLVCKKTLSCRSALQMHYRVHTGDRPFRCKICGRSFTTKGNLKTHMSVHRIKPPMRTLHQCPVCHQKFSNIFVLQQHIRLHTGEQTDLTPDQIRAAEIREFDSPFGVRGIPAELLGQKRKMDISDDESEPHRLDKSPKVHETGSKHFERPRYNPVVEQQAEDLRSLHLQKLSVRSNSRDNFSRGSSPTSQTSVEMKRMRSSSPPMIPKTPPVLRNQSPIPTPSPSLEHFTPGRPHLPYGNPFLGMPQFPPFMNQPAFMRNMPMLPHGANMPQFGLFGVRGNTTTCNICYKTFACNSALDIHYRSHTKERPFKCTTCDRGFSTKGNMKQHLLTHKIRDTQGNSNSGDEESHLSSHSSQHELYTNHSSSHQRSPDSLLQQQHQSNHQINFAMRLGKPQSPSHTANSHHQIDDDDIDDDNNSSASNVGNNFSRLANNNGQYKMTKEADIKKWCNKLNEIPENITAS